jgi:hypothetical protein
MSPRAPIGYYGSIYNRKSVNENIPGIEEVCFDESIHTICQIWIPEQYHNSNDLHYLACARTTNIAVASGLMVRTDQGWRVWGLKKNEEQIREIVYHDREIIWEMDGWDGDEDGLNGDFNCTRNRAYNFVCMPEPDSYVDV